MMKLAGMALLVCVMTVCAYAAEDCQPERRKPVQETCLEIHTDDNGDDPAFVLAPDGSPRTVSRDMFTDLQSVAGMPGGSEDNNVRKPNVL